MMARCDVEDTGRCPYLANIISMSRDLRWLKWLFFILASKVGLVDGVILLRSWLGGV